MCCVELFRPTAIRPLGVTPPRHVSVHACHSAFGVRSNTKTKRKKKKRKKCVQHEIVTGLWEGFGGRVPCFLPLSDDRGVFTASFYHKRVYVTCEPGDLLTAAFPWSRTPVHLGMWRDISRAPLHLCPLQQVLIGREEQIHRKQSRDWSTFH